MTPDQAAPRPEGTLFRWETERMSDGVLSGGFVPVEVDALIAQARAEERAKLVEAEALYKRAVERAMADARAEERAACDERLRRFDEADRVLGVMAAEDVRRAERARVAAVIAEKRACVKPSSSLRFIDGWRAACDAIEAGLGDG